MRQVFNKIVTGFAPVVMIRYVHRPDGVAESDNTGGIAEQGRGHGAGPGLGRVAATASGRIAEQREVRRERSPSNRTALAAVQPAEGPPYVGLSSPSSGPVLSANRSTGAPTRSSIDTYRLHSGVSLP